VLDVVGRRWLGDEDGDAVRLGGGGFLFLRAIWSAASCLRSITSGIAGACNIACSIGFKGRLH